MATVNIAALQADVKKFLRTYAQSFGQEAARIGPEIAKTAISSFYGAYSPKYYARTENLLNNSYQRYYKDNGTTIYGGVRISSANMNSYGDKCWSASQVANATWKRGLHGKVYTFPPYSMAQMALGSMSNTLEQKAEKVARSQSYSVMTIQ